EAQRDGSCVPRGFARKNFKQRLPFEEALRVFHFGLRFGGNRTAGMERKISGARVVDECADNHAKVKITLRSKISQCACIDSSSAVFVTIDQFHRFYF